ncbi:MAG: SusD/RagB family nutrient-binding outer membrane lipoprotein [Bacteroidales bacterium]|nr:SusD/RagB family nutrient-binding outer membrane lipoprotein [Candidatus Cacconaster equi]
MKKIFAIMLLAVSMLSFSSCQKWLDVNNNVDAPDHIDGYLYLAGILANTNTYWDIRATSGLTQMFYNSSYSNYYNHYYSAGSDAAGETWRYVYWLHGKNLENMINQSIEAENWTLAGIGLTIKAFDWDNLTKLNADAPMKQAYEPNRLSHDYDYQEDIYPQILAWADTAIFYLTREDKSVYGNTIKDYDLAYAGDKAKWLKLAHSVIVSNLASLTCKKDFKEKYYNKLVEHAAQGIQVNADNFTCRVEGGGGDAPYSSYNNWNGVYRGNLDSGSQGDYAVQIMTGTVPEYNDEGFKVKADLKEGAEDVDPYFPYKLAEPQIICDTIKELGHFDPRVTLKIGTTDACYYKDMNDPDSIMRWKYFGAKSAGGTTPQNAAKGVVANIWGNRSAGYASSPTYDGEGRWLYHNSSPYIYMTAAELKFMLAEAHFVAGNKSAALAAFKEGVALDVEFCGQYILEGAPKKVKDDKTGEESYVNGGALPGGDHVTADCYKKMGDAYIAGPYVNGLQEKDFTLSHIMMQKYVALFPWGASEAWVDLRKYHYDIPHTKEVPTLGDGWDNITTMNYKKDTDPTKVYKGFYLDPMQVEGKSTKFDYRNEGSPCYRLRPRYNSEYMWNMPSLQNLKPTPGDALNYQCSIPWFAYPGDVDRN